MCGFRSLFIGEALIEPICHTFDSLGKPTPPRFMMALIAFWRLVLMCIGITAVIGSRLPRSGSVADSEDMVRCVLGLKNSV